MSGIGHFVSGFDHFAIHVTDLARSAAWYEKIFEWSLLHKWNTTWMVGRGGMKVGLFLRPDATAVPDLQKALVIQHIALAIDGDKFDEMCTTLTGMGVPFAGPEDSGIAYSIFLEDPDGHSVEVTTYHPATSSPPSG